MASKDQVADTQLDSQEEIPKAFQPLFFLSCSSHPVSLSPDCFNLWLQDPGHPSYAFQLEQVGLADSMEEKTENTDKREDRQDGENGEKEQHEKDVMDADLAAKDEERLEEEVTSRNLSDQFDLAWRVLERHEKGLRPFQLEQRNMEPDPSMLQIVPVDLTQPEEPVTPEKGRATERIERKKREKKLDNPKKRPSAKASARKPKNSKGGGKGTKKQRDGKGTKKQRDGKGTKKQHDGKGTRKQTRDAKKATVPKAKAKAKNNGKKKTEVGKQQDDEKGSDATNQTEMKKRLHSAIWLHCVISFLKISH